MRSNLPVTTVEYPITDDTLIASRTDTKGRLTYFNDQFVEASGFTEAELMGQPHNIIRHPDMPPEAFENLWDDAEGGQALVRRREEPPQERRLLLGAGDRFSGPGEWTGHRLYLDPNQAARRSARGSRTGLRGAARQEGARLPHRCGHHPPPLAVRPPCDVYRDAPSAIDHLGGRAGTLHADHRAGWHPVDPGQQCAPEVDL